MDTNDIQDLRRRGVTWLRKQHPTLTRDEHEDVLQDALIELVRKDANDPGALLGTIIDRRAADLIRAKKKRASTRYSGSRPIASASPSGKRVASLHSRSASMRPWLSHMRPSVADTGGRSKMARSI